MRKVWQPSSVTGIGTDEMYINILEDIITIEQRFEITVSLNMFALNFGNRP
jgi:hypothetical protein